MPSFGCPAADDADPSENVLGRRASKALLSFFLSALRAVGGVYVLLGTPEVRVTVRVSFTVINAIALSLCLQRLQQ